MYSPHLMNGNFLIMLSILPYHAMGIPCIIHFLLNFLRYTIEAIYFNAPKNSGYL